MDGQSNFKSYVSWKEEPPLIDFDDTCAEAKLEKATMEQTLPIRDSDQLITLADSSCGDSGGTSLLPQSKNKVKLCGYLNKYKLGARGIGKNFKRRWFTFADNTCKLLYYRTAQDIVPLGEIDIYNATLSFQVGEDGAVGGRTNVFEISSGGRIYYLEAADQQTMMYWLQQLQRKRRAYSAKKSCVSTERAQLKTLQQPSSGLLRLNVNGQSTYREQTEGSPLVSPVEAPGLTVGEAAASTPAGSVLSNLSIANWKTELRNAMANIRSKRNSDGDSSALSPGSVNLRSSSANLTDESSSSTKLTRFESLKRRVKSKSQDIESTSLHSSTESLCGRCKQLESAVNYHQEEVLTVEEELLATRELLRVLQKEIDLLKRQLNTQSKVIEDSECTERKDVLILKDKTIVDLEHLVATVNEEKEMTNVQLRMMESRAQCLENDIEMYKDSLHAKDETIVSLTRHIFDLEASLGNTTTVNASTNTTLQRKFVDTQELDRLNDTVAAYKMQNQFLNKEILELNKLRENNEERERQLFMRCTEWEARYLQVHSKYLLCLEQLQTPQMGGESKTQEVVTELLSDAMNLEKAQEPKGDLLTSQSLNYSIRQYDKYGFMVGPRSEEDLLEKASLLQRRSNELLDKDVGREISHNVRWENYFIGLGGRELQRSQELKSHIREGIPCQHKDRVWKACVSFRVGKLRESLGPNYYQNLLVRIQEQSHRHNPAVKQIELDLLRTLPNNRHYETMVSEGIPKLKRVLRAYTQHNPDIGYCQGQNRLAAIALLFLEEEDAFWCLVAITEFLMPVDYYSSTLSAAQVDQRVLKDLMSEKMPQLMYHLETQKMDISLFTFNWFLTIFVDNIPPETYLRIWDAFLYEGNKVLFRFAMAFLKYRERELLAIQDNIGIHNFLRTLGENSVDIKRIAHIAFHEMNPLPMRIIENRRQFHMIQVKNELEELDALRCRYRSSRRKPHELNTFVSDDEA